MVKPGYLTSLYKHVSSLGPKKSASLTQTHPDLEAEFISLYERCAPFTMTSVERMYSLWQAINHLEATKVGGDIVECGVWRGGSSMLAALTLMQNKDDERSLWLYDTFSGMSEPTANDVDISGQSMVEQWEVHKDKKDDPVFAFGSYDEVESNISSLGWPDQRINYVVGKVEDTIPAKVPNRIALLRLDTDWYESTRHELENLYRLLEPGGILIIDDYGHWSGAKQAVTEFFATLADPPFLSRIDYTGRIGVKPGR